MPTVQPELLRETDRVTVWQTTLQPEDSLAEHDHQVGYVVVVLEGEEITVQSPDATTRQMEVFAGEVLVGGPSPVHSVTNTGTTPYREIMVELKS